MTLPKGWLYFGCWDRPGHHLRDIHSRMVDWESFGNIDGPLCPKDRTLYMANVIRFPKLNYSALAWWDQTVDTRPGSNAAVFAPSPSCSTDSLLAGFEKYFPQQFRRLPIALTILPNEIIKE